MSKKMALIAAFRPISTRPSILRHRSTAAQKAAQNGAPVNLPILPSVGEDENANIRPSKHTPKPLRKIKGVVSSGGPLRPFRLLRQDLENLGKRYISDWAI